MADVDQQDQAIVISVVYDGPPEAGKTTSVRALARGFGREVFTPEERNGRTVYFDWLEHTGGRFAGAPIRCQIASVPGQRRWTRRRGHFLERADVVVFVGDTSAAGWPESLARLRELRGWLDGRPGVPVGVVFQANKRDRPDAVAIDVVRQQIGAQRIAIVESIADDGTGVREAFVFAVRLALDRVREGQTAGAFVGGRPSFGTGDELFELLRGIDPNPVDEPAPLSATPAELGGAPRPPSEHVPSGCVWPPIDGRIALREAATGALAARFTAGGDVVAGLGTGWRFHSAAGAVFGDLELGRASLIAWARAHASAGAVLSRRRCIVLGETGDGRWRLWQIVRTEPSLRDAIRDDDVGDPRATARRLAAVPQLLASAAAECARAAIALPCTLDSIGVTELGQVSYLGLVPDAPQPEPPLHADELARELAALLRDRPASELAALCDALRRVRAGEVGVAGARVAELLADQLAV